MTQLERGVAYGRGMKGAFYAGPFSLSAAQVSADVVHHLLKRWRALCANGVGFHILVEHLIGIEVRAVGGQEDEADLGRVFVDPLLRFFGAVDRMSVHDHEELSFRLPLETAQEVNEHVRVELASEHVEAKLASVGDGRHHRAASALTACLLSKARQTARNRGGVPFHTVAAPALIVHAHAHFVCPPQRGILLPGLLTDLRIFCLQPPRPALPIETESDDVPDDVTIETTDLELEDVPVNLPPPPPPAGGEQAPFEEEEILDVWKVEQKPRLIRRAWRDPSC